MSAAQEFVFDLHIFAALTVPAKDEAEARTKLTELGDAADIRLGDFQGEASVERDLPIVRYDETGEERFGPAGGQMPKEMLALVQKLAGMATPLDANSIAAWKTRNPADAHLLEGDDGLPLAGDDLVDAVYEHVVTGEDEASAANDLWSLVDHAREMLAKFAPVDGQSVAPAEARV